MFCHWLKLHIMTSRLSLIWPNYHSIGKWTTISHHINVLVFKTTKLSLFYWSTKQIYRCIPRRYRSLTNTIIFPVLWSCWEAHLPAQARGQVRSRHLLRVRGRQESPPVSWPWQLGRSEISFRKIKFNIPNIEERKRTSQQRTKWTKTVITENVV